jgi:hypothetical protein
MDLQTFARAHPRVVQYDLSRKAYVRVDPPNCGLPRVVKV